MAASTVALPEAISILTDWDHQATITATLRTTRRGASTLSSIIASPEHNEWSITDGPVVQHRTADGVYTLMSGRKELERAQRDARRVPPALWLAFPLSAPIWGRPRDMWKMVDAARSGDSTEIRLVHTEHAGFE